MHHLEVSQLFAMLVVMLGMAKLGGRWPQRIGQPAVLGELIGGVVLGQSGLNLVRTDYETIHMFSELGVFILLLAIGLETNVRMLLRVGGTSSAVALVGVVLPFGLGYAVCHLLGLSHLVAIMAGATLTATSVGITARVLSDLGRLRDVEGQVILGAAVLDDILGLVILTVVTGLAQGNDLTLGHIAITTGIAFGFSWWSCWLARCSCPGSGVRRTRSIFPARRRSWVSFWPWGSPGWPRRPVQP